jgi:starch-binding outer membrane protein, SusD/RagB family
MKSHYPINLIFYFIVLSYFSVGCTDEFLDKKSSTSLIVPTGLDDFQRLLDNYPDMNATPALGEASSDDYFFVDDAAWDATYPQYRNAYIWKPDVFEGVTQVPEWNSIYYQIFVANVVLTGLEEMNESAIGSPDWNYIKGWALFIRSHAFFNLVQLFAPVYDENTASTDFGIPLRTEPGVDKLVGRSSVQETYNQILQDLQMSAVLLPATIQPNNRNRPSKPTAYALLARVALSMRDYAEALEYADLSLGIYDELLDYNNLGGNRFQYDNSEVLFHSELVMDNYRLFRTGSRDIKVDTLLLKTYAVNDLRRSVLFEQSVNDAIFRNSYSGRVNAFGGIATDEIYLIKAECLARSGHITDAMDVLNRLWINRADNSRPFVPLYADTSEEALKTVLSERRKELIFRGLRWQDLRRLNKEGAQITITRIAKSKQYVLEPNSHLYVFPIPLEEIQFNDMPQNERF